MCVRCVCVCVCLCGAFADDAEKSSGEYGRKGKREHRKQWKEKNRERHEQRKKEREEFHNSLKGKTGDEYRALVEAYFAKRLKDAKENISKKTEEIKAKINSSKLSDEKKTEALARVVKRHAEMLKKLEKGLAEHKAFLLSLADKSPEERKAALKAKRDEMKAKHEQRRKEHEQKMQERKEKRKERRESRKGGKDSVDDELEGIF